MSEAALSYPRFSEIVRTFAPGWFAAVMGTGVLSLATLGLSARWAFLSPLAWGLHYFNLALFVLLAIPWLGRWLVYREAALGTLRHPVQASFYPTFSIGMLVIASQFLAFGPSLELALLFWWPGALLTFLFSFAVLFTMFSGDHVGIEHVTPAKFIPAVGLVVIPVAGGHLLGHVQGAMREWIMLIDLLGLGAGMVMYLGLLSLTLQRKYLAKPAFGILTPTVWIHVAPLAVIPVSLLNVVEQLPFPVPSGVTLLVGLLFWSFGVWWLVMALLLTLAARRRKMLPFALSWWGFTFPLGIFVVCSLRLAKLSSIGMIAQIGLLAWLLLLLLWSLALINTVRGVVSGDVFRPHP